jgi:hypothetical protein
VSEPFIGIFGIWLDSFFLILVRRMYEGLLFWEPPNRSNGLRGVMRKMSEGVLWELIDISPSLRGLITGVL